MKDTNKPVEPDVKTSTIEAFHQMWDFFPHLVLLLRKDRTIVDANRFALDLGVTPSTKCYQLSGGGEIHKVCRADSALMENVAKRSVGGYRGRVLDSYWLPVPGENDLYIHFAIDITEYAKPELLNSSLQTEK